MDINLKVIKFHFSGCFSWVRIFGHGFTFRNIKVHPPLFSGRRKENLQLGDWRLTFLDKEPCQIK